MKMIDKKITVSIKEFDTFDKGIQISPRMTFGAIAPPKLDYVSRFVQTSANSPQQKPRKIRDGPKYEIVRSSERPLIDSPEKLRESS